MSTNTTVAENLAELTLMLARSISLLLKTPLLYEIVSFQLEAIHHDGELGTLSFPDYNVDLVKEAYFIAGLEKHLSDPIQLFRFEPRERISFSTRLFKTESILATLATLHTCLSENAKWSLVFKASHSNSKAYLENIANMRKILCMTMAISPKDISWMTDFHKEMFMASISSN